MSLICKQLKVNSSLRHLTLDVGKIDDMEGLANVLREHNSTLNIQLCRNNGEFYIHPSVWYYSLLNSHGRREIQHPGVGLPRLMNLLSDITDNAGPHGANLSIEDNVHYGLLRESLSIWVAVANASDGPAPDSGGRKRKRH